jgi:hypothetical protein
MILSVLFPVLLALLTLPFTILRIILLGTTILQPVFHPSSDTPILYSRDADPVPYSSDQRSFDFQRYRYGTCAGTDGQVAKYPYRYCMYLLS